MSEPVKTVSIGDVAKNGGVRRYFDFTLNISHIIVGLGMLATLGGFALALRDDVREAGGELKATVAELRNDNKLQDQTILQLRSDAAAAKAEESNFRSEMRQAVTELQKLLTDIRIQAAAAADGASARGRGPR